MDAPRAFTVRVPAPLAVGIAAAGATLAVAALGAFLFASSTDAESDHQVAAFMRIAAPEGTVSLFKSASADGDELTVQVVDNWGKNDWSLRYMAALQAWDAWASIRTPTDPTASRLQLVDSAGQVVGGTSPDDPSKIWVAE